MIPQYFSVGKISLNGGKRGETGDLSKRSSVIASWSDWVVAAPSEKYIYVIQVKGEGKMEKKEIKPPSPERPKIERPKILDLAIYFIEKEKTLLIFVCLLTESPDNGNPAKKEVYRLAYSNISGIHDIVNGVDNRREDKLFGFDCRDSVREDTKISLGFDKNPYEEFDARPTRIYVGRTRNKTKIVKNERNEQIERNEMENVIEIYDMTDEDGRKSGSTKPFSKVVSKVNENKENKLEGISVSYHNRLNVAIAYQNSVVNIEDIDKENRAPRPERGATVCHYRHMSVRGGCCEGNHRAEGGKAVSLQRHPIGALVPRLLRAHLAQRPLSAQGRHLPHRPARQD